MWQTNGFSVGKDVGFEEIKIPVPWGYISGKWWGFRTQQPIIAIHGWQDNAGSFDKLAPLLVNKGFSLLCIDMPGHGLSSHYSPGHYYYLFWDGLHLLRRIINHFKWENITIMGHSMGGAIAFLYASVYPGQVKKYISFDITSPAVRDPYKMVNVMGESVDKFLKYENLVEEDCPCYDYEEMLKLVEDAYAGSLTRKSCEIMMQRGMRPLDTDKNKYTFVRDPRLKVSALGFFTVEQVLEFASRIRCPVLNIKATRGIPFDNYDFILDEIEKNAEKVIRKTVEGTHHVHLNDAENVSEIVADFLMDNDSFADIVF